MTKNERVFEIIEISRIYDCFAPNTIYYGPRTNEYAARTNWEHANKETRWNGSNRLKIRNIAQFTIFLVINYELEQSSLQHANYDPVLKRACMPNGPQPHPRPETNPKPVETVRNRYNNSMNSSIFTPEVNN